MNRIILVLALAAGVAFVEAAYSQEQSPPGAFILRATGSLPIPLYDPQGELITSVPVGADFGYELPEGYVLQLVLH